MIGFSDSSAETFKRIFPDVIIKREPTDVGEKALAWVDKYKPKNIKDIIGQGGPASNCSKYERNFILSIHSQTTENTSISFADSSIGYRNGIKITMGKQRRHAQIHGQRMMMAHFSKQLFYLDHPVLVKQQQLNWFPST